MNLQPTPASSAPTHTTPQHSIMRNLAVGGLIVLGGLLILIMLALIIFGAMAVLGLYLWGQAG